MPRSMSSAHLHALAAAETDVVFHTLIRVRASGLPSMMFTDNIEPIIYRGDTYEPAAMKVALPDSAEGRGSEATLSIENIDRRLITVLRSIVVPPRIDIYILSSIEMSSPMAQFDDLRFAGHQVAGPWIDIRLTMDNLAVERFPEGMFDKTFLGIWP